jgi:hypothetical protein
VFIDDGDSLQWVEISTAPTTPIAPIFNTTTVDNTDYNCSSSDYYIGVNHSKAIIITLPPAPEEGKVIRVKDQSGNSNNFSITITVHNGALIDGNPSNVINKNYDHRHFIYNDGAWYIL